MILLRHSARRLRLGLALALLVDLASAATTHLVEQQPAEVRTLDQANTVVDFGRVAFGNLLLRPAVGATGEITVRLGEAATADGRINRTPPGSVRYAEVKVRIEGDRPIVVAPPPDQRNTTTPDAVLTPAEWGVILPFRWVEIEGWPGTLRADDIRRRAAFLASWDDKAAAFASSDETLNRIWELCRYTMKATTFAGILVDGDRERIPYEADAYLNQLGLYTTTNDTQIVRDTFDWLMARPTWPTEWASHMILMAHADWRHTGDVAWLRSRYDALKTKLLTGRVREDGLVVSTLAQIQRGDLVDWPVGERDGFELTAVNTVVNAFHVRTLTLMAELATALGRLDEAQAYRASEAQAREAFQRAFFDPELKRYRDGESSAHCSVHANLFPLAFGLVPEAERPAVRRWLVERGMACSVYAAQYYLEGLFENGADETALHLIVAPGDRSWKHMLDQGTTITWEAWDQSYKPNQDWNHAWGAAPANLLPRFVLGVSAASPGWQHVRIRPHPGGLRHAAGTVPTPRGPVAVHWTNEEGFDLTVRLPVETRALVEVPCGPSFQLLVDGRVEAADRDGDYLRVRRELRGDVRVQAVRVKQPE